MATPRRSHSAPSPNGSCDARWTFQAMSTDSHFLQALQGANFSFTRRPEPIAGDLRMSWGIGIVLLSLLHSRGKKGSFLKLQFRSEEHTSELQSLMRISYAVFCLKKKKTHTKN